MQQPPEGPGSGPGEPAPEDPREREPLHDPPVHPEHDLERKDPGRQTGPGSDRDLASEEPSPDQVIFDEEDSAR